MTLLFQSVETVIDLEYVEMFLFFRETYKEVCLVENAKAGLTPRKFRCYEKELKIYNCTPFVSQVKFWSE